MRRLVLALALTALVAAGCGHDEDAATAIQQTAETEGLYVDVNGLKYQIQMSRYMNPNDVEDQQYLVGLPEGTPEPSEDEIYFGVWVRVENTSEDETRPAASIWEIHDTQENVYRPIPIDTDINPFAFNPGDVPPKTVIPLASSAAGQGPIQGLMLLFKIRNESFQNRPLELNFRNGGSGQVGTYDLDV
ncbi:MAG TPA: hypothetical protein VFX80_09555 [Solirubrobacteraceae bacterium]|nr:hypothetical protein [Solirubrobacteraceae bacterium]